MAGRETLEERHIAAMLQPNTPPAQIHQTRDDVENTSLKTPLLKCHGTIGGPQGAPDSSACKEQLCNTGFRNSASKLSRFRNSS